MSSHADCMSEKQKETRFDMPGNDWEEPAWFSGGKLQLHCLPVLAPPYIKLENSGPLGLLRFAVTTFVFCLYGFGVDLLIR